MNLFVLLIEREAWQWYKSPYASPLPPSLRLVTEKFVLYCCLIQKQSLKIAALINIMKAQTFLSIALSGLVAAQSNNGTTLAEALSSENDTLSALNSTWFLHSHLACALC